MFNEEIKTAKIYNEEMGLPWSDSKYRFRFRVVSKDLSSASQWSGVYHLDAAVPAAVPGQVLAQSGRDSFLVTWTDQRNRPAYDVFIKEAKPITTISRNGTLVTITTAARHGFSTGDIVRINISSSTLYDGDFEVTKTGTTTFTYNTVASGTVASTAVTGTATPVSDSYFYYHGTTPIHTYSLSNPQFIANSSSTTAMLDYIQVRVQVASVDKKISNSMTVYDSLLPYPLITG